MDKDSQTALQVLESIAKSVDRLHHHGYKLYIDTKSKTWTNRRTITVSGEPYFYIYGNSIQPVEAYSLMFGISIAWKNNTWKILAEIERESNSDEDYWEILWEQEYKTAEFNKFTELISQATTDLIRETSSEWFAEQVVNN
jgi:hypothetical protein